MKKQKRPAVLSLLIFLAVSPLLAKENLADKRIAEEVRRITPELIEIRRDIHAHPESAFQEVRTAALVADYFRKLGLEVGTGIAGTGVLGILRGGKPGPVVGMRADMDALPITEETGLPFASRQTAVKDGREVGLMHACGHDIHTTVMLGVASVLSAFRKELPGTVLFVAQPAEEDGDGANEMLKAGVFKEIKPEAMFAFHVDDTIKAGYIKYTPGYAAANVDGFTLVIESTGCHGSDPSSCVDPIVVGAQVVIALQVMVAREIDVHKNTVITVGTFHAGTASNIIPQKAELRATIRNYGDDQRKLIREKVERVVRNVCEAAGAPFELDYRFGTPSLYNDPELMIKILPTVERILGGKNYLREDLPGMGGEDFSYFALEVPAVMLGLGVVPKDVEKTSVHSPTFLADEESIPVGVRVMSAVIRDYLAGKRSQGK